MNRIYYAHHIWKYGTEIENYEIKIINESKIKGEVLNPSTNIEQNSNEMQIMKECYKMIDECNIIVLSSLSGIIGKGVFNEVIYAIKNKKKVYYIKNGKIKRIFIFKYRIIGKNNREYAIVKN